MSTKQIFGVLFFSLFFIHTKAAGPDPCGCNEVLNNGIFSYRAMHDDKSAINYFKYYVSKTSFSDFQKDKSSGLNAFYEKFSLGASANAKTYKTMQQQFITDLAGLSFSTDEKSLVEKFGDENIINAWKECKKGCWEIPVSYDFSKYTDQDVVNLVIAYDRGMHGCVLKVKSSNLENGKNIALKKPEDQKKLSEDGYILSGTEAFTIKILDPTKIVSFSINFEVNGYSTNIEGFIPKPIPPLVCDTTLKSIPLAGNSVPILINPAGELIKISWTTTGGEGTAWIGKLDESSNFINLKRNKDEILTTNEKIYVRSGSPDGKTTDQRATIVNWRKECP